MQIHKFAAIALTFTAGCAVPSQPGTSGTINNRVTADAGQGFSIAVGQEAQIRGTQVILLFRGVTGDSRCAKDVQCVWAGDAVVRLSARLGDGPATEVSLHTTLEPKTVPFGGYTIKLTALKPDPVSTTPIPASAYIATLEISQ